ncbi:MAG TPA: tonB-system energizer ExbB, partial [Agrobacterium sp.]|nr:tonB-system energizer ExbB [Agrobacterium sp.]
MSAATSTSSASFTKANKTRHISLAMTAALLAGLSAGAVFAQSASDTQSAPATETVQPAQQPAEAPATPSAPAIQPAPPSAAAPE